MGDVQSYVIVSDDTTNLLIQGGPLAWDGVSEYDPGVGMQLILTADALNEGYYFPPPVVTPQDVITTNLGNAISTNDTYLALPDPADTDIAAQVVALTTAVDGLIRLTLQLFDSTDDC